MIPINQQSDTSSRPTLQIHPPNSQQFLPQLQNAHSTTPPTAEDPPAPPYSPIQPEKIASLLTNMSPYGPPSVLAQKPKPVPIAESDNVDVIALRSAIQVLQLQHMTAEKDIKALQKLKEEALKDPEGYVRELVQRINQTGGRNQSGPGLMGPTVGNLVAALGADHELFKPAAGAESSGTNTASESASTNPKGPDAEGDVNMDDDDSDKDAAAEQSRFPAPPNAQNVYRMPPINWTKYHVVGSALDNLHEEQRRKPSLGQPEGLDRSEEYVMAAPYAPVVDAARLAAGVPGQESDHPMVTRGAGRRVGSR